MDIRVQKNREELQFQERLKEQVHSHKAVSQELGQYNTPVLEIKLVIVKVIQLVN